MDEEATIEEDGSTKMVRRMRKEDKKLLAVVKEKVGDDKEGRRMFRRLGVAFVEHVERRQVQKEEYEELGRTLLARQRDLEDMMAFRTLVESKVEKLGEKVELLGGKEKSNVSLASNISEECKLMEQEVENVSQTLFEDAQANLMEYEKFKLRKELSGDILEEMRRSKGRLFVAGDIEIEEDGEKREKEASTEEKEEK